LPVAFENSIRDEYVCQPHGDSFGCCRDRDGLEGCCHKNNCNRGSFPWNIVDHGSVAFLDTLCRSEIIGMGRLEYGPDDGKKSNLPAIENVLIIDPAALFYRILLRSNHNRLDCERAELPTNCGSIHGHQCKSKQKHEKKFMAEETNNSQMLLVTEIFYVLTMLVLKIALAIFFLRIMVSPWQRRIVFAAAGLSTVFNTGYFFYAIFQCGIPQGPYIFFIKKISGQCITAAQILGVAYTHGAITALTDLVFAIIPRPGSIVLHTAVGWASAISISTAIVQRHLSRNYKRRRAMYPPNL